MITIDWSYTRDLTTYDGKIIRIESKETLAQRIKRKKDKQVIAEEECPLSIIHYFIKNGLNVSLINNHTCKQYHQTHNTTKTDANDAKAIWDSIKSGVIITPVTLETKPLHLYDLYHQYNRFQKARISIQNMKLAHQRGYGIGESRPLIESRLVFHPMPDLSPYNTAISLFTQKEGELQKTFNKLLDSNNHIKRLNIKGIGKGLWMRIAITANPNNFKNLSAYLRYCGLTRDSKESLRYSRYASALYYLAATETIRWNDEYKELYAKLRDDIRERHQDYTKAHINYAAINRIATFLAKRIFAYGQNNKILPII